MKIIMVNKFLYSRGGAETYFLKIGKFLENAGHQVVYLGMKDAKNTVGNPLDLYTTNMDFRKSSVGALLYPLHILYSFEAKRKLQTLINAFQPDLIHLNNINFQLTPSVIDAAAKCHVPMVQTVHDFQMLCPNHMMLDLKQMTPCDRCVEGSTFHCTIRSCIHSSKVKSILGSLEGLLYRYRSCYKKVECYICPSFFMQTMLLRRTVYRGKTEVIHNFIETAPKKLFAKKDYVLYFGRLSAEKGIDTLLQVCKRLPHISFVLAGSGPMEERCAQCGLDNVSYVGFKGGEELETLVAQAAFSVYLPVWYENCPLSVLESQSLGTPVLATAIGGIPELVEDGVNGRLLSHWDVEFCTQQIGALWADKLLLSSMQQNCLDGNVRMINLEEYTKKLMKIYHRVLKQNSEQQEEYDDK